MRVIVVASSREDAIPVLDELRERAHDPELVQAPAPAVLDTLLAHAGDDPVIAVLGASDRVKHDVRNIVIAPLSMQLDRLERALGQNDVATARKLTAELRELVAQSTAALAR